MVIRRARSLAGSEPEGILAQLLAQSTEPSPIESVFQAARQGHAGTLEILESVGHYLGIALSNLVNIFNPELIILGGMFAQGQDLILPVVRQTLRQAAFAGLGEKVKLATTSFGWRAGVTGAAALALLTFFYNQPAPAQSGAATSPTSAVFAQN